MNLLPLARNTNIIIQQAENELLVYDLTTHQAYNLNETSKIVFNACNGKTSFEELKRRHQFTDDLIYFALDELTKHNLIEEAFVSPFGSLTRREVVKRVGLASLVVLPMIGLIVAPTSAQALSCVPNGSPAASASQCCNGEIGNSICCSGVYLGGATPCTQFTDCCFYNGINSITCQAGFCCSTVVCNINDDCCPGLSCDLGTCR